LVVLLTSCAGSFCNETAWEFDMFFCKTFLI
jgi:hypothetical protein